MAYTQWNSTSPSFVHHADFVNAAGWAAECMALTEPAELTRVDGLSWPEQRAHMDRIYTAFANTYQWMNVRPPSDPAFHDAWVKEFEEHATWDFETASQRQIGPGWQLGGQMRREFNAALRLCQRGSVSRFVAHRIFLNERGQVTKSCFDSPDGEDACDSWPGIARWNWCVDSRTCSHTPCTPSWFTMMGHEPPYLPGQDRDAAWVRGIPPLRWYARFARTVAEQIVRRGIPETITQAYVWSAISNARLARQMGRTTPELIAIDAAVPADLNAARFQNETFHQISAVGTSIGGMVATINPLIGGAIVVASQLFQFIPAAVGFVSNAYGQPVPTYLRVPIGGTPQEPGPPARPPPPSPRAPAFNPMFIAAFSLIPLPPPVPPPNVSPPPSASTSGRMLAAAGGLLAGGLAAFGLHRLTHTK